MTPATVTADESTALEPISNIATPSGGDTQSSKITPRSEQDWLRDCVQSLLRLVQSPHDWDGYGSPPVQQSALETAILLLAVVFDRSQISAPAIMPVSGGGVQLGWHIGHRELELEVLPDGSAEYLTVEQGDPVGSGSVSIERPKQVIGLVDWATPRLGFSLERVARAERAIENGNYELASEFFAGLRDPALS